MPTRHWGCGHGQARAGLRHTGWVDGFRLAAAEPRVLAPGVQLRRGWHVQLIFLGDPGGGTVPERLWVLVTVADGETGQGTVSTPGLGPGKPSAGDAVAFTSADVWDVRR